VRPPVVVCAVVAKQSPVRLTPKHGTRRKRAPRRRRANSAADDPPVAENARAADEDWSAWSAAAGEFETAAKEIRRLKREMGAAVDTAQARRTQKRMLVAGALPSAVCGVVLTFVVQDLTEPGVSRFRKNSSRRRLAAWLLAQTNYEPKTLLRLAG
jgi:hypothetical protein